MSDLTKIMIAIGGLPLAVYFASFVSGAFAVAVCFALGLPLFAYIVTRH